jgi:lipopolysaccharide/colanic/teichoic acid biosynthesis glycosyltransferase
MVHMDIWYTRNLSPWLDLAIMVKTIPALVVQLIETRVGTGAQKAAAEQG